jgi:hypothetical protein
MKTLFVALTLLASSAFASNTYISYPKYDGMDVDNLCDAGKVFKSINPIQTCDSWTEIPPATPENYPSDWKCNSYHLENVEVSKVGTDCNRYGTGDADAATCYEIIQVERSNTVLAEKITDYGEYQHIEYFYYTIPACQ